ncbi:MAG: N-6 DNA methylase [Lachnospiraceae bacterium]|nr:N-6 DNA methylase [Lachnospiraceae bacterium]
MSRIDFSQARIKYNELYKNEDKISKSLCTVDGNFITDISIKDVNDDPNEEYYKWQFIYSLVQSELIPSRDYIGAEIYFPKGNIHSQPIKIDSVIFSDIKWLDYYRKYRNDPSDVDSLLKVRELAVGMIEYKRNDKTIEQVFSSQIRASIKESESPFVLGIYYDTGRLFLFKKIGDEITRFDNSLSFPNSQKILERYQLEITDPYYTIPSLDNIKKILNKNGKTDRSQLRIEDLDIVYSIQDDNMRNALKSIMVVLESVSLGNEEGYMILIQMIAMKIYDEKQRLDHGGFLRFYINDDEIYQSDLNNENVQKFIERMAGLYNEAKIYYSNILGENKVNWKQAKHVKIVNEIVMRFQDYSFVRSSNNDLYQLIFYNFATEFQKVEKAQFLTPLPIIDFIVRIVNPKDGETICDPCCGIADFLSKSYVIADMKLGDCKLYGFDNYYPMTVLAQLNMLLNGDGNAVIKCFPEYGTINQKYTIDNRIIKLDSKIHSKGNWDKWYDETELMKYDVILTNPPFGKNRSLDLSKKDDVEVAKLYELYDIYTKTNPKAGLDKGVVFLENAVRQIKEGKGRFAIVLSNAIMSNNTWQFVREWLMKNIRIVALFDLPENVFAETGVNTSILVGYKPTKNRLSELINDDYSVFTRDIENVGYKKKTINRTIIFDNDYALDPDTFETITNDMGESVLNEDFSKIIVEFKEWCLSQETEVKELFLE